MNNKAFTIFLCTMTFGPRSLLYLLPAGCRGDRYGIALRAHEPRISQENGKKGSEGCAGFCWGQQGETRYSLLRSFGHSALVIAQPGKTFPYTTSEGEYKKYLVGSDESYLLWMASLKPLSEEKSILIEHDYDGIQELDNPTRGWFMYLFYATNIFAVGYMFTYHVFDAAPLQDEEYTIEMKVAAKEKEVFLANAANQVDEKTVKLSTDPAMLASGAAIFKQSCAPCHGEQAQGMVGPNLTDDYWLHGGKIDEVFKTIKYGVTAKGMPNWEKQLTPKQIADVANYIKSVHGTNPANAKEAQGSKKTEDGATPATQTAMVVAQ